VPAYLFFNFRVSRHKTWQFNFFGFRRRLSIFRWAFLRLLPFLRVLLLLAVLAVVITYYIFILLHLDLLIFIVLIVLDRVIVFINDIRVVAFFSVAEELHSPFRWLCDYFSSLLHLLPHLLTDFSLEAVFSHGLVEPFRCSSNDFIG